MLQKKLWGFIILWGPVDWQKTFISLDFSE